MIIIDEILQEMKKIKLQITDIREALDYDNNIKKLSLIEKETASCDFWNDTENANKVIKKQTDIKAKLKGYENIKEMFDDFEVMIMIYQDDNDSYQDNEIQKAFTKLKSELENVNMQTLLNGDYDSNNAIMTFHSGAGGTEAQDWVEMLYRMYTRWAEAHKYKMKVLDYLDGDEAGIKSAQILIEGANAYGFLKAEAGVHRLVRISPFDSSGRRHTSFASIEVMPEIEDDNNIEINPADLRVDTYRAGGAGGQHVNKTDSAVRLTHIPTGVVVCCQNERSQHQNKDMAMKVLRSKLIEIKEREHLEKIDDIKGVQKEIGWGSQIRSYVFMPYTMVKDHRTNCEIGNINAVMDGDIDVFINEYLKSQSLGNI